MRNKEANENIKSKKISKAVIIAVSVIIALVICLGVYVILSGKYLTKGEKEPFNTAIWAEVAGEENAFQYSSSVVEAGGMVISVDNFKITARKAGTNEEVTLIEGNIDLGIVTDGKTVYYYDLDKNAIMSLDVKTKKTKEIVKVLENIKKDEKTDAENPVFAKFDGKYKDYLYYQVAEGMDYMPNYMVNLKTGKVKKLELTQYGTYKFQIAYGKLYFDMYRTSGSPTILYRANPDGSEIETICEGVGNFEVIGEKLYYLKFNSHETPTNKIMEMDLKTEKTKVIRDGLDYSAGAFTSYAMISERDFAGYVHTVVDYFDGTGEALNGNGANICADVAIVHLGIYDEENIKEIEEASTLQWFIAGNKKNSQVFETPKGTSPVNFKDGYVYYYSYSEDGRCKINRLKVEL